MFTNVYRPYLERYSFWNNIQSLEMISHLNLVPRANLNFSLELSEILGPSSQKDSLLDSFLEKLVSMGLLDIEPGKIHPTWSNRSSWDARVSKNLDHFNVGEALMNSSFMFC